MLAFTFWPRINMEILIMDAATLLKRFEALEKRNRNLRRINTVSFAIGFLLLALTVCEFTGINVIPKKSIYTQALYLQDSDGKICAEMTTQNNLTMFSIYDENNQPRVALSLLRDEPGIHLYDYQGVRRAVLGLNDAGPSMMFMTRSGVEISGMMTKSDGTTDLFIDELGAGHEKMPVKEQTVMAKQEPQERNWMDDELVFERTF